MNTDDLSDEAFWSCTDGMTRLQAWQECRRRATAQVADWMISNHWATGHGDDIPDLLKELKWQIDEMVNQKRQLTCAACGNPSQASLCESCQEAEDRRRAENVGAGRDHR